MASTLITTKELTGARVVGGKGGTHRIGKVRRFVFHPKAKRCVGFIVKRPDLALMFHRKDLFVAIDGYDLIDGQVVIREGSETTGKAACKAMGIDWDSCVLWVGLPVMTESGKDLGFVGDVTFDRATGAIESFETDSGATSNTLLGTRIIPADMVRGFKRGIGAALVESGAEEADEPQLGAILVADEAGALESEGGVAEKAGAATAVAVDKVQTTVDKAKPVASQAAKKAGEAVNKGAYATGKQISKSKNMFKDFKDEYNKAVGSSSSTPKKQASAQSGAVAKKPASSSTAKAAASSTAKKPAAKKAAAKKPAAKQKGMFAAFKDEYDKARRGE